MAKRFIDRHELDHRSLSSTSNPGYTNCLANLQAELSCLIGRRVSLGELAFAHYSPDSSLWQSIPVEQQGRVPALIERMYAMEDYNSSYFKY